MVADGVDLQMATSSSRSTWTTGASTEVDLVEGEIPPFTRPTTQTQVPRRGAKQSEARTVIRRGEVDAEAPKAMERVFGLGEFPWIWGGATAGFFGGKEGVILGVPPTWSFCSQQLSAILHSILDLSGVYSRISLGHFGF